MNCKHCNSFYIPKDKNRPAQFCSRSCATLGSNKGNVTQWVDCACCMAKAGIGFRNSAKLLGITTFSAISSALKHRGVKKEGTAQGWRKFAQKQGFNQNTGKIKWWGSDEAENLWLSQQKASFPDWSYVWTKEKSRRESIRRYHAMSQEDKKALNKSLWEKRKQDPLKLEKCKENRERWKKQNPERHREQTRRALKKKKQIDPGFKVLCNMRNRLKEIIGVARDGSKKWNSSLVGCDTRQLAAHLESKFTRGMSWANYGTDWHVDHIIPCSAFDHTKPEQVRQCWHWTNLRPLWAKENLAKSNRITEPQLSLLL